MILFHFTTLMPNLIKDIDTKLNCKLRDGQNAHKISPKMWFVIMTHLHLTCFLISASCKCQYWNTDYQIRCSEYLTHLFIPTRCHEVLIVQAPVTWPNDTCVHRRGLPGVCVEREPGFWNQKNPRCIIIISHHSQLGDCLLCSSHISLLLVC